MSSNPGLSWSVPLLLCVSFLFPYFSSTSQLLFAVFQIILPLRVLSYQTLTPPFLLIHTPFLYFHIPFPYSLSYTVFRPQTMAVMFCQSSGWTTTTVPVRPAPSAMPGRSRKGSTSSLAATSSCPVPSSRGRRVISSCESSRRSMLIRGERSTLICVYIFVLACLDHKIVAPGGASITRPWHPAI